MTTKTITILLITAACALAGCENNQRNEREAIANRTAELLAKMIPTPTPWPSPTPEPKASPIPAPEIVNPWETDEERAAKAGRKGYTLDDGQGYRWALLVRDDSGDVTKGLPPERTMVRTPPEIEPSCEREADGWTVHWKKTLATPTPTATIAPTATP